MEKQTNDSLSRAVASLGAVEVRPAGEYCPHGSDEYGPCPSSGACDGTTPKPALYAAQESKQYGGHKPAWFVLSEDKVPIAYRMLTVNNLNRYAAIAIGVKMPAWWSPEQRFAWALDRKTGNKREAFDGTQDEGIKALSRLACHITNGLPRGRKRITADLTTGAEVPA